MENDQKKNDTKKATRVVHDQRVFIGLPCYGGKIDSAFMHSMMQIGGEDWLGQVAFLNGDSLVNRARNKLAHQFLEGQTLEDEEGKYLLMWDWLLFLDTDLIFTKDDCRTLYELAQAKGPGIYAGTYPVKQLTPKIVFNQLAGQRPDKDGVLECRETGTGFMLIHRNVFEQMVEKFGDEMRYEADASGCDIARTIMYDFFTVGVRLDPVMGWRRFLSEDWYFCQRWREIGGKVLLHTGIRCQHIGQFTYPADPQEILKVAQIYSKAFDEERAKMETPLAVPAAAETIEV